MSGTCETAKERERDKDRMCESKQAPPYTECKTKTNVSHLLDPHEMRDTI